MFLIFVLFCFKSEVEKPLIKSTMFGGKKTNLCLMAGNIKGTQVFFHKDPDWIFFYVEYI